MGSAVLRCGLTIDVKGDARPAKERFGLFRFLGQSRGVFLRKPFFIFGLGAAHVIGA